LKKGDSLKRVRWRLKQVTIVVLLLLLIVAALTNPTKQDYINFDEERTGIAIPENVRIVKANFYFFSVYASAPMNTIDEYGIAHLGFMGNFYQVTNGQYDDSIWETFFH
jgi:hypothetical protein